MAWNNLSSAPETRVATSEVSAGRKLRCFNLHKSLSILARSLADIYQHHDGSAYISKARVVTFAQASPVTLTTAIFRIVKLIIVMKARVADSINYEKQWQQQSVNQRHDRNQMINI